VILDAATPIGARPAQPLEASSLIRTR